MAMNAQPVKPRGSLAELLPRTLWTTVTEGKAQGAAWLASCRFGAIVQRGETLERDDRQFTGVSMAANT